jgi:hypothetical protein
MSDIGSGVRPNRFISNRLVTSAGHGLGAVIAAAFVCEGTAVSADRLLRGFERADSRRPAISIFGFATPGPVRRRKPEAAHHEINQFAGQRLTLHVVRQYPTAQGNHSWQKRHDVGYDRKVARGNPTALIRVRQEAFGIGNEFGDARQNDTQGPPVEIVALMIEKEDRRLTTQRSLQSD